MYSDLQPTRQALTGTTSKRSQSTVGRGDGHLRDIVLDGDVQDLSVLLRGQPILSARARRKEGKDGDVQ